MTSYTNICMEAVKKPRTRKPVVKLEIIDPVQEPVSKGGRKSKGAKIVSTIEKQQDQPAQLVNVILHLKCSTKELNEYNEKMNQIMHENMSYNPVIPQPLQTFNANGIEQKYSKYDDANPILSGDAFPDALCKTCSCNGNAKDTDVSNKEINAKLRNLKVMLSKGMATEHKSCCFWDTCEYDNPSCIIPTHMLDGVIYGYGSFCRPECAVAHLMGEAIDDSTKFERYQLLNFIYGEFYGHVKNIKPAPSPHYTLDKFFGNMTIQEYRKMLKSNILLMTIDKPLTRMLPELHEEIDDTILNKSGMYKVKRQSEKVAGPSKTEIMKTAFGVRT